MDLDLDHQRRVSARGLGGLARADAATKLSLDVPLPTFFPTRAHVLVCTGPRCLARGARALFEGAWREAEARELAYHVRGGSIRLTESGCQGACEHGPNAIAYFRAPGAPGLAEAWYAGVDLPRLLGVMESLHRDAPLPRAGRYDPAR